MVKAKSALTDKEEQLLQSENLAERQIQQYLTFLLEGEMYAVDILRVREIMGWSQVTRVPNTPVFMKGVLNLRGAIVPVVDLRLRFDLQRTEYNNTTVIIILAVRNEGRERTIGIVVDGVSDVINVDMNRIKPVPKTGTTIDTDYLTGLFSSENLMLMLLDID
jgi:purine-binding chemotaxis protein CheW